MEREHLTNVTTDAQCHALALLGKQYALDTIQLAQAGRKVDSYYAAIETGRVANRIIALRSQQAGEAAYASEMAYTEMTELLR